MLEAGLQMLGGHSYEDSVSCLQAAKTVSLWQTASTATVYHGNQEAIFLEFYVRSVN